MLTKIFQEEKMRSTEARNSMNAPGFMYCLYMYIFFPKFTTDRVISEAWQQFLTQPAWLSYLNMYPNNLQMVCTKPQNVQSVTTPFKKKRKQEKKLGKMKKNPYILKEISLQTNERYKSVYTHARRHTHARILSITHMHTHTPTRTHAHTGWGRETSLSLSLACFKSSSVGDIWREQTFGIGVSLKVSRSRLSSRIYVYVRGWRLSLLCVARQERYDILSHK